MGAMALVARFVRPCVIIKQPTYAFTRQKTCEYKIHALLSTETCPTRELKHTFTSPIGSKTHHSSDSFSVETFADDWLNILASDSLDSVLTDQHPLVLSNLRISWLKCWKGYIHGKITLSYKFCKDNFIDFGNPNLLGIFSHVRKHVPTQSWISRAGPHQQHPITTPYGYFIITYHEKDIYITKQDLIANSVWYSCAIITSVMLQSLHEDEVEVLFYLHPCSQTTKLPPVKLRKQKATVMWIRKSSTASLLESAVKQLPEAPKLVQMICMLPFMAEAPHKPLALVNPAKLPKILREKRLLKLNDEQVAAIHKALHSVFMLIQGPPGTGKSITGAYLAYIMARENMTSTQKQAILYCGPSNASVDVVCDYLKGFNDIKIVRVYGGIYVRQDFPYAGKPLFNKTYTEDTANTKAMVSRNKDIALHHLIRKTNWTDSDSTQPKQLNKLAEVITKLDNKFIKMKMRDVYYSKDFQTYMDIIKKANQLVLQDADIILSTCTSSSKLKQYTRNEEHNSMTSSEGKLKIHQVIVDECGMCTLPQTLLPLVSVHPEQIIFIGDHKQLQPVVMTKEATGLEISLFQSYADRFPDSIFMLKKQYRMHQGLNQLPSKEFYENKLICGTEQQCQPSKFSFWPGGHMNPVVFCDIPNGTEMMLPVSSVAGSFASKSNAIEAGHVINIVKLLVENHGLKCTDIAVLSPYRAQCFLINEMLNKGNFEDVHCGTIISSQGSQWSLVLISTVRSSNAISACGTDLDAIEIDENTSESQLGFVANRHQINVALTRAIDGLIILGNKSHLEKNVMWKRLFEYYNSTTHNGVETSSIISASHFTSSLKTM